LLPESDIFFYVISWTSGVVATIIGAYVISHLSWKNEEKKIKLQDWKKAIDDVYSPLTFFMDRIRSDFLSAISAIASSDGILKDISKLESIEQKSVLFKLVVSQIMMHSKDSEVFENTLIKNLGLIKPMNLCLDLYLFDDYVMTMRNFIATPEVSITGGSERDVDYIKRCAEAAKILIEAVSKIRPQLIKMTLLREKIPDQIIYEPFFNENIREQLENKIGVY
jgi:hypothetical protein